LIHLGEDLYRSRPDGVLTTADDDIALSAPNPAIPSTTTS
jgi:hypothetical protein